jgi:hypothetical protein
MGVLALLRVENIRKDIDGSKPSAVTVTVPVVELVVDPD